MSKTKVTELLTKIKKIRERATMESTVFKGKFKTFKIATANWRETWIIDPLDEVIKMLEAELNREE